MTDPKETTQTADVIVPPELRVPVVAPIIAASADKETAPQPADNKTAPPRNGKPAAARADGELEAPSNKASAYESTTQALGNRAIVGSSQLVPPPQLLPGEIAAGYEQLLARVMEWLQPRDVIEEIWALELFEETLGSSELVRHLNAYRNSKSHEGVEAIVLRWDVTNAHTFALCSSTVSTRRGRSIWPAPGSVDTRLSESRLHFELHGT